MKFKQQRIFGLIICTLLSAIGLWLFFTERRFPLVFLTAASLLLLITITAPQRLSYPTRLWAKLGHQLETINNYLVLSVLFFLLLTPVGLIARGLNYDPLKLKQKQRKSYWQQRDKDWDTDSFKDQF